MMNKAIREGIHLVSPKPSKKEFHVGETVPASGIYRVFHSIHRVSHEVTLIRGEQFPPCHKCGDKVYFKVEREVPAIDGDYEFRVRLFQIPHPQVKEAEEETA
jgi:hypothetical protein